MIKTFYLLALGLIVILCSGCETFKGMGKDIENTGNNIQEMLTRAEKPNVS